MPGDYFFALNKIDAETAFKITRSANYESNAFAVANKQIDVAPNNRQNLEKIKGRLPEKFNDIRIVRTLPLIPLDPLAMRKEMPETTRKAITESYAPKR